MPRNGQPIPHAASRAGRHTTAEWTPARPQNPNAALLPYLVLIPDLYHTATRSIDVGPPWVPLRTPSHPQPSTGNATGASGPRGPVRTTARQENRLVAASYQQTTVATKAAKRRLAETLYDGLMEPQLSLA